MKIKSSCYVKINWHKLNALKLKKLNEPVRGSDDRANLKKRYKKHLKWQRLFKIKEHLRETTVKGPRNI